MPLTCNIDSKGKLARLIWGLALVVVAAVIAIAWALPAGGWLAWMVVGVAGASGAFAVFEARAGWCVVRAMGIRTPM